MKLFVRLMALILVAALAGPYFIKGPDGQPLLTVAGTKATIAAAGARIRARWDGLWARAGRAAGDDTAGHVEMYRWQDAQGQWHYASEPPDGGQAERILVDPNASRMDPVTVTPRHPGASRPNRPSLPAVTPASALSPGGVKRAIDEAQAAREAAEERDAELERRARSP